MDQWCRDFDNWSVCDTVCFALFDHEIPWGAIALFHEEDRVIGNAS